ncbi:MAG: VOC family protein [Henriciella sp.]|nr:VOC family protein [Henriciella sp.]
MRSIILAVCGAFALSGCIIIESDEITREVEREVIVEVEDPTPVADNPLDLRRTTLVVRDIEKSLALYRDALGMTVEYDQELTSPSLTGRYGADGQNRSRLVLLKANDSFIGMLGLWQFLDQTEKDLAEPDPADFTPGEIVLLFNSNTLDTTFPAAATAPGVTIIGAPKARRYPSPAGDIVVMVSMLVDNDGHTVELNQLISDPRTD